MSPSWVKISPTSGGRRRGEDGGARPRPEEPPQSPQTAHKPFGQDHSRRNSHQEKLNRFKSNKCSSRISPSIPSSFSDLGVGRASGFSMVVEIDASMGLPADEKDGSYCLNRDLSSPGGVSDVHPPICPLVFPLKPSQVEVVDDLSAQGGAAAHPVEAAGGSVAGGVVDGNFPRPPVNLVSSIICQVTADSGSSDFSSMETSVGVLSSVVEAQVVDVEEK
ncbi:hypothetical protein Dimus_024715 [Dionaea muscipula]